MHKKTKSTNTVAYATPPETQATTNLQNMVNETGDASVPIRNSYARAEQNLDRSYQNPLGAFTTADVRDKSSRSQHSDLQQNLGAALGNAAQQTSDAKFGRQATVAGLTAPQLYNSGGTQSLSDPFGQAIQLGQMISSVASAGLS